MKILILVLSYNESPYKELMQAQQNTWDDIQIDDIRTMYYYGQDGGVPDDTREFKAPCTDAYYYMAAKFRHALNYIKHKDYPYDIIFRTNSSSYVHKQRLKNFAETLPTEKLYAGWEIQGNAGYNVVSGAGIFLSRDTAEILRENIDPDFEREEDCYCAQILHEHGVKIIDDKSRCDIDSDIPYPPTDRYHYRFKTGDRLQDANNMRLIHEKIK